MEGKHAVPAPLTNLLWEYSFIVPALMRFGPSRIVSKSMPDTKVWPMDEVLITRAFPSADVFADSIMRGRSRFVR